MFRPNAGRSSIRGGKTATAKKKKRFRPQKRQFNQWRGRAEEGDTAGVCAGRKGYMRCVLSERSWKTSSMDYERVTPNLVLTLAEDDKTILTGGRKASGTSKNWASMGMSARGRKNLDSVTRWGLHSSLGEVGIPVKTRYRTTEKGHRLRGYGKTSYEEKESSWRWEKSKKRKITWLMEAHARNHWGGIRKEEVNHLEQKKSARRRRVYIHHVLE